MNDNMDGTVLSAYVCAVSVEEAKELIRDEYELDGMCMKTLRVNPAILNRSMIIQPMSANTPVTIRVDKKRINRMIYDQIAFDYIDSMFRDTGIRQKDLSFKYGISQSTVSKAISTVSLSYGIKIEKLLRLHIDWNTIVYQLKLPSVDHAKTIMLYHMYRITPTTSNYRKSIRAFGLAEYSATFKTKFWRRLYVA